MEGLPVVARHMLMLILHISVVPSQQVLGTFPSVLPPKLGIAVKAGMDGIELGADVESVMGPDGGGLGFTVKSDPPTGIDGIGLGLNVESVPGNEQARLWQREVLEAVLEAIH